MKNGDTETFLNRKVFCSFETKLASPPDDETVFLVSHPMCHFKPLGLMLFGVTRGMSVQCYISNSDGLDISSYGTLPAMLFARAYSYEKLYQMLKEGEENLNEWSTFHEVHVGQVIRLVIRAARPGQLHDVQAAMWGMTLNV